MRRHLVIFTVVVYLVVSPLGFATEQEPAADQAGKTLVKLLGKPAGEGKYKLALEYKPGAHAAVPACILVWSEPSRTLLLTHCGASANAKPVAEHLQSEAAGEALAKTEGELGNSHPRVIIPYSVGSDTAVVVEFLMPSGDRKVVMAAQTSLEELNVSSEFDESD